MTFLKKYYSQLITFFLGGLAGFFIAITYKLKFEDKISPIAVASLVLTIIIALYLEFSVRPSLSNSRNEKDLFIDQLKDIKAATAGIQELYHQMQYNEITPDDKKSMLVKFRLLSNGINSLKDIIEYSGVHLVSSNCQTLLITYINYKKALTGYEFDKETFQYNKLYFSNHARAHQQLNSCIQHFIIDVNKLS